MAIGLWEDLLILIEALDFAKADSITIVLVSRVKTLSNIKTVAIQENVHVGLVKSKDRLNFFV